MSGSSNVCAGWRRRASSITCSTTARPCPTRCSRDVGAIPGWETVGGDVAGNAAALIEQRLSEVRTGLLTLNREEDADFFDKQAGIKPYALDNSPLISLFTLAANERPGVTPGRAR
jgi:hypothetical protein